jgi:hypothetical protein
LDETRNLTAWDNQLKGCMTRTRKSRYGKRNRKSNKKKLITYFLWSLEAPFDLASDKDPHLDRSTIILAIRLLQFCKSKQDSTTRPRQTQHGQETIVHCIFAREGQVFMERKKRPKIQPCLLELISRFWPLPSCSRSLPLPSHQPINS